MEEHLDGLFEGEPPGAEDGDARASSLPTADEEGLLAENAAEGDLYRCPAGQPLRPRASNRARRLSVYQANAATSERCELRPRCTHNKTGRQVLRYFDERYVDRVRAYRGTSSRMRRHCARGGCGWSPCSRRPKTDTV